MDRDAYLAYRKAHYQKHRASYSADSLARYYVKKAAGGITPEQKAAKSAYDRAYRLANAEHLDRIKVAWRAANAELMALVKKSYKARRRQQEEGGDSTKTIKAWLGQQRMVCRWCSADCAEGYHIDHVQPLAKGGKHEVANLCVSCPSCNLRKNVKSAAEFQALLARPSPTPDLASATGGR